MAWQILPGATLAQHAQAWDTLQRATSNTPFLETAFLLPLLTAFGSGRESLALHHNASGQLDAATLVAPTRQGLWETFQPSQLPLGPWVAHSSADLAALGRSLMGALPGLTLGIGFTQLDPKLQPRPADDGAMRTQDYIATSYIDITDSFETYWEARGKNLRQNTRKQRNKLQAEATVPSLECITQADQVPEALRDYGALESAGWKAGTGTAIHPDNAQGRFYLDMLQNFCKLGRARIYRYRFGDKVVSMDLCIDNGPLVVILKTAYDESYKAVSPSTLMRQDEFQAWWEEGRYQRIEFYGKTMEWHTRWTESQRTLYHATQYRWPWLRRVHDKIKARRAGATVPATPA